MRILRNSDRVAGICGLYVEPVQGSGGYLVGINSGGSGIDGAEEKDSLQRRFDRWLDNIELWVTMNWQVRCRYLTILSGFIYVFMRFCRSSQLS